MKQGIKKFLLITACTLLMAFGLHFFRFPNNFSFGGITGLAVVLQHYIPFSAATINLVCSMALLVVGLIFLGKKFFVMTGYCSILLSVSLSVLDALVPMTAPMTDQPMLELCFAVAIPSFASAILFNVGASGGGMDIVALMMRKYTRIDNIGTTMFLADVLTVTIAFFAFDVKTGLYSALGLLAKSLVVDGVIENVNLCKYFNIICDDPEPITDYILHTLNRSATVSEATGAFSHNRKYIVMTVLSRPQSVALRAHVKKVEPDAFVLITSTSEIVGKGFHHL